MQSQDDRDAEGLAARRDRENAVKEFAGDEITGQYEGEELEEARSRRPTPDRIKRLEKKQDELKAEHTELKGDVKDMRREVKDLTGEVSYLRVDVAGATGKIDGQQGVLTEMLSLVKKTAEHAVERGHIEVTTMLDVDRETKLARVELDKETKRAAIEVIKEEKVDAVKEKADRRKRNLKILGLVASGGGIIELLHRLGVL